MKSQNITRLLLLICINLLLFGCQNPPTHHEPPYEGPPKDHIISVDRALEMYNAYSQRRVPIIQRYEDSLAADSSQFTPTRYAEYNLETIKQYIAYIEHEAKKAKVDIKTLRFYFSNYPDSKKFQNGDIVKYPRRNSFFVLPTIEHEENKVGFYLEDIDGEYTAVPIMKYSRQQDGVNKQPNGDEPAGNVNEAGFFTPNSTSAVVGRTSLILNDSHITPPPGSDDFGNN